MIVHWLIIMALSMSSKSYALQGPSRSSRQSTKITVLQAGVMNRGLERKREGATPQEGGMTLYLKAASDGTSPGDCPFAHAVRMVLEEKGLEYELRPCVQETKPRWLIEHYDGKMPALRHSKECYVESEVICQYLDFFFPNPNMTSKRKSMRSAAEDAVHGFFPSVAKYLKHTTNGDEEDNVLKENLIASLQKLEDHFGQRCLECSFLCGEQITILDCSLAPKLYHLKTGLKVFKAGAVDLETQFPMISKYMETIFARPSFLNTKYTEEVIAWGWSNARQ